MLAQMQIPECRIVKSGAERRLFPRIERQGTIVGTRLDHSIAARKHPHLTLALRDMSVGGVSAISDQPLGRGERIAVTFPPEGFNGGWKARGRVVRCEAGAVGYRVAVAFDLEFGGLSLAA